MAKVGQTLANRFELLEELGRGASGAVYRARDTLLDTQVCIKVLIEDLAGDADVVERFKRELLIARKVTHPGVCKSFDLQQDGERVFLVMEYVEGENLNDRLNRQRPLPVDDAVQIIRGAAQALGAAHAAGVVHRDLKPANILIRADGSVSVVDFGIAIATDMSKLTQPGLVLGSKKYVAPERWVGEEATPAVDVWSLGVILYGCLTGRLPYRGDGMFGVLDAIKTTTPEKPSVLRPEVPKILDDIVFKALAKAPGDRYVDANALEEALSIVDDAGAGWSPETMVPPASPDAATQVTRPIEPPNAEPPMLVAQPAYSVTADGEPPSSVGAEPVLPSVSEAETAERPLISGAPSASGPRLLDDEARAALDAEIGSFEAGAGTAPEQGRVDASVTAPRPSEAEGEPGETTADQPPLSLSADADRVSANDAETAELQPLLGLSSEAPDDEDLFSQVPDRRGARQASMPTELVRGHKESSFPVARVIAVKDARARKPPPPIPYGLIAAVTGAVGLVLLGLLLFAGDGPAELAGDGDSETAVDTEATGARAASPSGGDAGDLLVDDDTPDDADADGDAGAEEGGEEEGEPDAWDFVDDASPDSDAEGDPSSDSPAEDDATQQADAPRVERDHKTASKTTRKGRSRRTSRPEPASADRSRYKNAVRAAGRRMAARGLLAGDDAQLDNLRRRAARAAKKSAYASAATSAEQALARAGEVPIDKDLVSRKLKRLNTQYDRLQDAAKRKQVAEAMRAARQPYAAQDWVAANKALNRAFKALR